MMRARKRTFVAMLLAVLMVVPMGIGLVQLVAFNRAGDRVVEQLTAGDLDAALVQSVLRVAGPACRGGGTVTGTAFVLGIGGGRGLMITNRHVVEDVSSVGLRRLDGGAGPQVASWRVADSADVAVLTLADPSVAPSALAAAATPPSVGDQVRTVGFPSGLPFTSAGTVGEVGASAMSFRMEVDPGASGSPVLNTAGAVVAQVFARTDAGRGVGTSTATVLSALDDLGEPRSDCQG